MKRMGARCESCLRAAVRIQNCRRECLEGPVGSPVFDFSGYLVGKWYLETYSSSMYGSIMSAVLIDEKAQKYRINYCYKAYGGDPCTPTPRDVTIGEYKIGGDGGLPFTPVSQFKWSDLGIPTSDWNAYKAWLLPCSMTDPVIDKPSANPGEIIKILAVLTNGIGADVTSYGDPAYLEFVDESNPSGYPVAASPATIWARYKWIACPPAGSTTLKLGPRMTGCDFEKSAAASCQVIIPEQCVASDFATAEDKIYECGEASTCLNEYCTTTGKKWRLTVKTTQPSAAVKYGPTEPGERTCSEKLADWNAKIDKHRRFCSKDNNYYWVTFPAELKDITPPPPVECVADADCPAGYKCVDGRCTKVEKKKIPAVLLLAGGAGVIGIVYFMMRKKEE